MTPTSVPCCILFFTSFTFLAALGASHRSPAYGPSDTTAMEQRRYELRTKRHVAEAMSDPYSILGFLSFATFIFCILYQKHKRPEEKVSPGGGQGTGGGGPGPGSVPPIYLQALDPQVVSLFKLASDILVKADDINKTSDSDRSKYEGDDYEDYVETVDTKTSTKKGASRFRR